MIGSYTHGCVLFDLRRRQAGAVPHEQPAALEGGLDQPGDVWITLEDRDVGRLLDPDEPLPVEHRVKVAAVQGVRERLDTQLPIHEVSECRQRE